MDDPTAELDPGRGLPAEPLIGVGVVAALLTGLVGAVVAFVPITDAQQTAILIVCGPAAALIVALVGRRLVWSPRTVARLTGRRPA